VKERPHRIKIQNQSNLTVTAAIRHRRQSMKPEVEVKTMNYRPPPIALRAADAKADYSST